MDVSTCKVGSFYTIQHKRKGQFTARYAGPGAGPEYFEFDILTWPGNGNEKLANSMAYVGGIKTQPVWSRKALHLSLITVSAPSSVVQTEWKTRAENAEKEYERLAGMPLVAAPPTVAPEPPVESQEESVAKPGFFKRLFGGNA